MREKQGFNKRMRRPKQTPQLKGEQGYLKFVKANDCAKDKITGCYKTKVVGNLKKTKPKSKQKNSNPIEPKKEKQKEKTMTKLER